MENIVIIAVLVLLAAFAIYRLCKAKKRGESCIGCPHAKECGGYCTCAKNNETKSEE